MSSQELTCQGKFRTLIALALIWFIAMFAAGCGGGSTSSNGDTTGSTPTPTQAPSPTPAPGPTQTPSPTPVPKAGNIIIQVNTGSVCDVYVPGTSYDPNVNAPLNCNTKTNNVTTYHTNSTTAYLNGRNSTTTSGGSLSYAWSFVSKPAGSQATLIGANTGTPSFVPDKGGPYTLKLVVTDTQFSISSPPALAMVMAVDDSVLNASTPDTKYHFHGGLPNTCANCHGSAYLTVISPLDGTTSTYSNSNVFKTASHMPTSNNCSACHYPVSFKKIAFFDHDETLGKCSDCHNGVIATGKSPTHIATTGECSDCHNTTSFFTLNANGSFDHTGITEPCSSCHDGVTAIGTINDPNPPHPSISVECNNCHTTGGSFSPPFVNHSDPSIPGTCGQSGCHNGNPNVTPQIANSTYCDASGNNCKTITGQSAIHPDVSMVGNACDACHNTTSFNMGGVFDHKILNNISMSCVSCHDANNQGDTLPATGTPADKTLADGTIVQHKNVTAGPDCSFCHNTVNFAAVGFDHTSIPAASVPTYDCQTGCHDGQTLVSGATVIASGPPNAPPALAQIHSSLTATELSHCGACHTPGGSFLTANVDHTLYQQDATGNITSPAGVKCSDCHDGTIATGKPSGHIVTSEDCGVCHEKKSATVTDWKGAGFDHSSLQITTNSSGYPSASNPTCTSCHDGIQATGQSSTHVPTGGQDCLVCHGNGSNYTQFKMDTFDHTAAGITSNCSSCHDGKMHDTTLVITKPKDHIPTSSDCSQCHADTSNGPGINGTNSSGFFQVAPFKDSVHPKYTVGCSTCHSGAYTKYLADAQPSPLSSTHSTANAAGLDCSACHSQVKNSFADPVGNVNHEDPSIKAQACYDCHDGNTPGAQAKGPTHPATSNSCGDCHHAGGNFTAGFDHTTLDPGGVNNGKYTCMTCHDGVTATGKTQNHVPTSQDCIVCHAGYPPTYPNFANGTFDHNGPEVVGKLCMDCHDGVTATGKPAGHVQTNLNCDACHTTANWTSASTTNHATITSGCAQSGCHNSGSVNTDVTDDPNPLPHIPIDNNGTEVDCISCHADKGVSFANAVMDHSVVSFKGCQFCHDGKHDSSNAAHKTTTQSATHFVTSITTCGSCHTSTTDWTQVSYKHSTSDYPGDHSTRRITQCSQCHSDSPSNANISTFPDGTYGTTCAVCHAKQGQSGHGNPLPSSRYNCGKSGCHRVSDSSFG